MILQILNPDNYLFNSYALPMLVVGATIANLGFFVFVRERWSRNGFLFFLMCMSIGIYLFATGANYASRDAGLSLLWIRISQLGTVFIPSTVLLFTSAQIGQAYRYRYTIAASMVLSTIFHVHSIFHGFVRQGELSGSSGGPSCNMARWASCFWFFSLCIMVFILRLFWQEYRYSKSERHKKRIGGLLIGFIGGYLAAVDFLPALGIPVYPFGYIPIFFFIIVCAYVVMRYELVDITPELAANQILETMHGAVIVADLEGRIQVINRVALEMLGYQKAELVGRDLASILPGIAERSANFQPGSHYFSGRDTVWPGRQGWQYDVSVFESRLAGSGNVPVGTVYVAHDITERKQAEKRLKESLSLTRATQDATADGILVVDNQGRISDFNEQFARLWRIPQGLLDLHDDQKALDFVLDQLKYPDQFIAKVRELYDHPEIISFDVLEFKDGRVFERYSQPQKIDGLPVGRVWSFRDITERRTAEEALRVSEAQLSHALTIAHLGHWEYDVAGDLFTFNDNFYAMLHTTAEQAGGYTMSSHDYARRFVHSDDLSIVADEIRQAVEATDPHYSRQLEHRIVYGDGKPGYITVSIFVVKDEQGRTVKTYGVNQDITERRLAEEALRESEAKYRMLVENISDVVWQTTPEYIFTYISPSDKKQGLFSQEEVIGRPVWEFLTPTSVAYLRGLLERRRREAANGKSLGTQIFEVEQYRKDGSTIWVEVSSTPTYDASGRITGYQGTIRNINDRKLAQEDLRRSEEHYRELFNAVTDVVFVHEVGEDGLPGKFLEVNEVACARLGYTRREFLQMSPLDIDAPESVLDVRAVSERVRAGEVVTFEQLHVAKDGRRIPVEINSRLFSLGTRPAILSLVRDITERKMAEGHQRELEEERLKTQKLESIGTLAGGIAHDFNNLLQGVFGYISMARLTYDQKEKSLAMLEHAEEALHLAVNLTTQLLTFAKGGKPVTRPMRLMPDVENAIRFALSGSHTDYRIDVAADLWSVEADKGQLAQVIQNVVLNAKEAMAGKGTVTVVLENAKEANEAIPGLPEGGRFVRIAIQDSGIGIPEQILPKVFDPYFTTKQKGSGLGLATSYSIIKNHGGSIHVKSEVDKGSTFSIYLPAAAGTEVESETSAVATVGSRKGRVLFMDDEEMMRKVAKEMLAALGHEMECAADGNAAMEMFIHAREAGRPFDIVILDLTIRGGMGGEETLRHLLEIDPGIVAVVSSGYADNEVLADYRRYGFSAFLNKPYKFVELRDCLSALLK